MPSTRSRIRQSQSESQSQSSSLESSRRKPRPKKEETFESLSTAILPLAYTIKLATSLHAGAITEEKKAEEYVRGQEFLSDGIRRVGDVEGVLGDLVAFKSRKRRRLNDTAVHKDRGEDGKEILWYTASLRHACSCDLEALPAAFTLRRPPPISDDLDLLPDELEPSERIRLGDDIPVWHRSEDGYVDLESDLDHLNDFEADWRNASGTLWAHHLSPGRFCEALDEHEEDPVEEPIPENPIIMETPVNRWLRKGKFRALDPFRLNTNTSAPDTPMQVHAIVLETPYPPARVLEAVQTEEEVAQEKEKTDWERECKRRKKLWRGLVGKDPGYGGFWDSLSRPHSYPNLGGLANMPKPPDYNLFRKYQTVSHPYHPDLHRYTLKNPNGRVYWLIPIHGPVIVPNLNDDVFDLPNRYDGGCHTNPILSYIRDQSPQYSKSERQGQSTCAYPVDRIAIGTLYPVILTTPPPLEGVWSQYCFSGPKPDPFIALLPPPRLVEHVHGIRPGSNHKIEVEKENTIAVPAPSEVSSAVPGRPVRVEAGDHMRIYCDAKEALSLRTWLHGIHVDGQLGQGGNGEKGRRLFDKVRLCLIGEKGEVLIVA